MKKSILLFAATLFAAATFAQTTPTVSASSVTFKYCETTDTVLIFSTIVTPQSPFVWETPQQNFPIYEYGTGVYTIVNDRGCDSIVTITLKSSALSGKFSIDDEGTQVQFSKGNLQYRASKNGIEGDLTHKVYGGRTEIGEWRFAEHQYDFISQDINDQERSITSTEWIDLLPWGSSGDSYKPYDYYGKSQYDIYQTNDDWGWFNEISNGGAARNGWFTMTQPQWDYLIRRDNFQKMSYATVDSKTGVIFVPDDWTSAPSGCSWTGGSFNYSGLTYTKEQWQKMEEAGAVFLPHANDGTYWASTGGYPPYYWYMDSYSSWYTGGSSDHRFVRLVRIVQ